MISLEQEILDASCYCNQWINSNLTNLFNPINSIGVINIGVRWKHFQTVRKHRKVVRKECRACGLWWRGLVHDLSKYSRAEFVPSAKYYQGNRSPIEAEKEDVGYSDAWLHHKAHNKHHWEYWCDYNNDTGEVFPHPIPKKYIIEMICDWIGAGKVYSKEKWTQAEPLKYYLKVRGGRYFHPDTEALILRFLELIRDDGLEQFHKIARQWLKGVYKHERNHNWL